MDINNPAIQQVIQYIAAGVLQQLNQRFPGGIPDPHKPQVVLRTNDDGMQVRESTTLIQQIAELNDNMKDLVAVTAEALDESRRGRRRVR